MTCGGTFTVKGAERVGRRHRARDGHLHELAHVSTAQLEHRVLDALRTRLLQPDLVEAFVEEYRLTEAPHNARG